MATRGLLRTPVSIIFLLGISSLAAQENAELVADASEQRLVSLHGTVLYSMSEEESPDFGDYGLPSEIWAKGGYMRTETDLGDSLFVSIQRDNTLFTFSDDSDTGTVEFLRGGLGELGLVDQIAEIRAHGEPAGTSEIEGVTYDLYRYEENMPAERALVYLSRETLLPRIWISTLYDRDGSSRNMRMDFTALEANIEIPDEFFEPPVHIEFIGVEKTPGQRDEAVTERSGITEDEAETEAPTDLLAFPHNLNEAYLRMFRDTIEYLLANEVLWAENLHLGMLWRAGLAKVGGRCYLEGQSQCLLVRGKTDREIVLEMLEKALPADLPGWSLEQGIDRNAVVGGMIDLMALLLAPKIDVVYSAVEQMEMEGGERQPAPELVYSLAGATGRYRREEVLRMRPLSGASQNVGFLVMSNPVSRESALFVRGQIDHRVQAPVPDALSDVTMNEISAHLAETQNRERLASVLVPEGRTGGVSLYLSTEVDRAVELANSGRTDEAIAIVTAAREESDNPAFNEYLDEFLAKVTASPQADSIERIRISAEQGDVDAQFTLGMMYHGGEGVTQDLEQAAEWFRKAAVQGHAVAQHNLGFMYMTGQGVAQNNKAAVEWFRRAAEQGYPVSQHNLGIMYSEGQGVRQDYAEAIRWFRMAADQGYASASDALGVIYSEGSGVEQDYAEAARWYRGAAEQGHPRSQYDLGLMYRDGRGVSRDSVVAYAWLSAAQAQGQDIPEGLLESLLNEMTEREARRAADLAREYRTQFSGN